MCIRDRYSAVGSALRSGRRGLEFKSQYSDHSENRTRQPKTCLLYTSFSVTFFTSVFSCESTHLSAIVSEAGSARQILVSVLVQALKLLHPFMPVSYTHLAHFVR